MHHTWFQAQGFAGGMEATRWLSWYGVGLASADRLPVVVRIPAGPLGSLKCDPPKGNGRRQKKKDLQVAWNVQFITVFVPAWMISPMYHSLRRESIKNTNSDNAIGVQSVRPTWFEDIVTSREPDSSINMQWPAYWHVWLFEESIAILFNDCAKHWYINCYFQADLRSFAAPCIRSEQTSFGHFC